MKVNESHSNLLSPFNRLDSEVSFHWLYLSLSFLAHSFSLQPSQTSTTKRGLGRERDGEALGRLPHPPAIPTKDPRNRKYNWATGNVHGVPWALAK